MQSFFAQFTDILWRDALNLHCDELINREIAKTRCFHAIDIRTVGVRLFRDGCSACRRLRRGGWGVRGLRRSRHGPGDLWPQSMTLKNLIGTYDWLWVSNPEQSIARDQCSGETNDAAGQSNATRASGVRLEAQQAQNAFGERPAIRRHGQNGSASPFFHQGKGARVLDRASAQRDGDIVATVFALGSDAPVHPPYCWMVEQQGLN